MDKEHVIAMRDIEYHYQCSVDIAMEEIERLATAILLDENNDLEEYWQAMGTWGFEDAEGNNFSSRKECPAVAEIEEIMDEWDEYLKLTGLPMHLYWLNGEIYKETDW